ncbi:AI-2E family transporter [Cereibacter azotoformans]|nr:AI-2E family transporter [Cereibacter azotoformans]AXQ95621.1 AI-2E family transporter [Cereibacter sphaeroides]PTR17814.1 putative PurR-regulated permease PerM [Cereibacter azotoformans]UIJ32129.1 AI-2E family transporter [Cereibacter azotoformans]ULB11982.1 AI-2E family transporter [Cereibacter azotoformans]
MPDTDPAPRPPKDRTLVARVQTGALVIIAFAVVLFLLVQAQFILISLAVSVILFSLTSDAIALVGRVRFGPVKIPNWLATSLALLLLATVLLSVAAVIVSQVNTVLLTALSYSEQAPAAVAAIFSWLGQDAEEAVLSSIRAVEISGYLRTLAAQAGALMQATVLVILFVGFLFAERVWFPVKLLNLIGDPDRARRVEEIVGSIMRRVNRYLLVKTLVSAITGLLVWGVALAFGLDLAAPLGMLTFILNFIPSIGSIVSTLLIVLVAFVQTVDVATALSLLAFVGAIQFICGNVLDPMLMGRALQLSSFGIIISLAFWGAVWGIPGMFLSVPIMVALMIVSAEIDPLRPIAVLLSRQGLAVPMRRQRAEPVPPTRLERRG